ncbi:hypothetical protein N7449_001898 [Penicillium cf. viridicatum]|uniref:Aminoglycoside phosphotransferase domain-containing protein n=1 Tax=Penicillium cf. viridicatum TaxID=2972119 RepID=A0A9W9T9Z9_9EURO|nr:hypothetical protein N7449_001898 [Penicillium cf. viridicatum]
MKHWLIPRYVLPNFRWPDNVRTVLSDQIPSTPQLAHPRCVGILYDNQIAQLPFGLILKWSDSTRIEEVLSMQVARKAGLPVPRVICYGDHPDTPYAPVSILITRVPGEELGRVYETPSGEDKNSILEELKHYLEIIRGWSSLWGGQRICSLQGTSVRSVRVPTHFAGHLSGFSSDTKYNDTLNRAKKMSSLPHRIVFTHGDLKHHNIMVQGGKITAVLDWESAGWYPEYWDFTTALRFTQEDFWWYSFVIKLGGDLYLTELDCEKALKSLISAFYYW